MPPRIFGTSNEFHYLVDDPRKNALGISIPDQTDVAWSRPLEKGRMILEEYFGSGNASV
jgi:hypothetical protein